MKILTLDTSTKTFSLAVSSGEKVLRARNIILHRVLSSSIIPTIDKVLKSARVSLNDLNGFVVGLGPGSFTSLRVGLSTVKGLAFATHKPVVGISSLDAIAMNVKDSNSENVCVVCDAKRDLVYACMYQRKKEGLKRKSGYLLVSLNELLTKTPKKTIFVGDGIKIFRDNMVKHCRKTDSKLLLEEKAWYPKARNLFHLAFPRFCQKKYDQIEKLTPLYLYPQDCQVRR